MKILLLGDSFAADYTKKYPERKGWPNMLNEDFAVTNLAQAGCSEYKIYQQLISVDYNEYDVVIVCHTSPYRMYVKQHPVHAGDALHHNSDLIYSDVKDYIKTYPKLLSVVDFFENYFDLDHAQVIHNLICEKIEKILDLTTAQVIHITNLEHNGLYKFKNQIDFNYLFKTNKGDINHYDARGNKIIYQTIKNLIRVGDDCSVKDYSKNNIINKQLLGELPKPGKTGLDWFIFCYFADAYKNQPMLEIGAGIGGSLCSLLAFTDDVTLIDSWNQNWPKEPVEECISKINKQVRFIDTESSKVNVHDLQKYSFVHLDANKSFDLVTKDLELVSQCCTGVVCIDDYMNSMWPEVTWAVDEFIKNNPQWKKIFIGNHQIFLSQQSLNFKDLIIDFPIFIRDGILCLTYGPLPSIIDKFVIHGKMRYSWHNIAWIEGNNDL